MANPITIPLINVNQQNKALREEILAAIISVVDSGAFVMGPEVQKFEEEFKAYTSVKHAVSCASGTDALLLPLLAAEVGPGDEVLVPSFTFYATAAAPARAGAKPVFVDCDESYNISLEDLARKITPKTKAVIPVHLFGQMVDMQKLLEITKSAKQNICVIEDAAQSMGAAFKGKQTGLWGDFAGYSFYPTKNLGAMGDAGMMAALSDEGADRIRMLRVHGSKVRYYHDYIGMNSRLDSMQAAILRVKLKHLKSYEEKRGTIAAHYTKCFEATDLMKKEKLRLPVVLPERRHVWNQYTIRAKDREGLRAFLAEKGIGSEIYYPLCMHEQKSFAPYGAKKGDLPLSEKMEKEVLSLPMFPELELKKVEQVVGAIEEFFRS